MTFAFMSEKIITGKEFWNVLHSKEPFSIQFVTYDEKRNSGGKRIALKKAVRCGTVSNGSKNRVIGIEPANGNHHPYQVHISLIEYINNHRVI